MKFPDTNPELKARLRKLLVDAFIEGDTETFLDATRQLDTILRADGIPARRIARRGDSKDYWTKKNGNMKDESGEN